MRINKSINNRLKGKTKWRFYVLIAKLPVRFAHVYQHIIFVPEETNTVTSITEAMKDKFIAYVNHLVVVRSTQTFNLWKSIDIDVVDLESFDVCLSIYFKTFRTSSLSVGLCRNVKCVDSRGISPRRRRWTSRFNDSRTLSPSSELPKNWIVNSDVGLH